MQRFKKKDLVTFVNSKDVNQIIPKGVIRSKSRLFAIFKQKGIL